MVAPGVDVSTDSAHNVIIDLFVGGGSFLGLSYLAIQFFVLVKIVRISKKTKFYDPIFVSLATGWFCYNAQSVISINQIGLAVWGWVLSGALVAYYQINLIEHPETGLTVKPKKIQSSPELVPGNFVTLVSFTIIGLVLALIPIKPEYQWRIAGREGDALKLINASNSWPQSTERYLQTSKVLAGSNLGTEALAILRKAISHDGDAFNAFYILYYSSNSKVDKAKYLVELQRLDPLNKEFATK